MSRVEMSEPLAQMLVEDRRSPDQSSSSLEPLTQTLRRITIGRSSRLPESGISAQYPAPFTQMKSILAISALLVSLVRADLVVTEVMAKSVHSATVLDGDWWELTNTGSEAVDLSGYTWDDTPTPVLPSISTFPNISIEAGESIVILQADLASVMGWKSAWGLSASHRVFSREQFNPGGGGESFSGLSDGGDEVNVYDTSDNLVAHAEFDVTVTGKSKGFLRDGSGIYGLDSSTGKHAAGTSNQPGADTASPCDARIHFVTAPSSYGPGSYSTILTAENPGQAPPSLAATEGPVRNDAR